MIQDATPTDDAGEDDSLDAAATDFYAALHAATTQQRHLVTAEDAARVLDMETP